MGLYPKAKFGFDLKNLENTKTDFSGISGVGMALGEGVSNIGKKTLGYGVSHKGVGANAIGTGLKGAGIGLEIGSKAGPLGAAIGVGVGWGAGVVGGAIQGKKLKEEAENEFTQKQGDAITERSRTSRKKYGTLQGYTGSSFKVGGKIDSGKDMGGPSGSVSVILGGKLHSDGGNDIVRADTKEKVAETEREELLFSFEHTEEIEGLIQKYEKGKLNTTLEKLGKTVQRILLNETKDNSGIYA